jgi:hypothetical protein
MTPVVRSFQRKVPEVDVTHADKYARTLTHSGWMGYSLPRGTHWLSRGALGDRWVRRLQHRSM